MTRVGGATVVALALSCGCTRAYPTRIVETTYTVTSPRCNLPGIARRQVDVSGVATPTGIFVSVGDIATIESQLESIREWQRAAAPCIEPASPPVGRVVPIVGR